MTVQVVVRNNGNVAGDLVQIRGVRLAEGYTMTEREDVPAVRNYSGGEDYKPLEGYASYTGDPADVITLGAMDELTIGISTDHFADFATLQIKAKHA